MLIYFDARHQRLSVSRFCIAHTLREGNSCVDFLAKLGAYSSIDLLVHDTPPADIMNFLFGLFSFLFSFSNQKKLHPAKLQQKVYQRKTQNQSLYQHNKTIMSKKELTIEI